MQKELDSWVEEGVPYLIQDDVTCAHQYFEIHFSRNRLEPEKRLMLAVLQDALFCFQRYFCARDGRHRKSFWEAWQWFSETLLPNCGCDNARLTSYDCFVRGNIPGIFKLFSGFVSRNGSFTRR